MNNIKLEYKRCARGVWDTSVPGIVFDEAGVSNYARMFDKLCEVYPRGKQGEQMWETSVEHIRKKGKGKKYDCIIGVSGGTDSCYLLHIAKEKYGLKPLAVNLDNGWSSEIAVQNIKRVTNALNIDLETYVIEYEEVKAVLRAYMKAGMPWIDGPTDHAIKAALFKIASRENVNFVLNGSDFRSEGKQPSEWTYTDSKQMRHIIGKYENVRLNSYPIQDMPKLFYQAGIKKIKIFRPFNSIEYKKQAAQEFLKEKYGWEYYGGHHHENIFTKFAIAYWMPQKFGIDKRIITLSAQVLSGELTREFALDLLKHPPYNPDQMERDIEYVIKKLDLSRDAFAKIWGSLNHYYWDYPSYMPLIDRYFKPVSKLMNFLYPAMPTMMIEKQNR
jgi:N-acetyl sugar amidotransferase